MARRKRIIINNIIWGLFILVLFIEGCIERGRIDGNELFIKFPIKLSLEGHPENWHIDTHNGITLKINGIRRIQLNNIYFIGDFNLILHAYKMNNDKSKFLFNEVGIIFDDTTQIEEFYKKILKQNNTMYNCNCESSDWDYWIDVDSRILYTFYKNKRAISFENLEAYFNDPKDRFPININGKNLKIDH